MQTGRRLSPNLSPSVHGPLPLLSRFLLNEDRVQPGRPPFGSRQSPPQLCEGCVSWKDFKAVNSRCPTCLLQVTPTRSKTSTILNWKMLKFHSHDYHDHMSHKPAGAEDRNSHRDFGFGNTRGSSALKTGSTTLCNGDPLILRLLPDPGSCQRSDQVGLGVSGVGYRAEVVTGK